MILCKLAQEWYLSTGIDRETGLCWLRCGLNMQHLPGFQRVTPPGMFLYGSSGDLDAITFYPDIRYKGCGGRPVMWKPDGTEPILYCEMGTPPSWSRQQREAKIAELEAEGWKWDRRDGIGRGYVHVDDLEKVEGPPPEGAF